MRETWTDRFARSIGQDEFLRRAVSECVAEVIGEEDGVARLAVESLAGRWVTRQGEELWFACPTDSPIEQAMYWAILLEASKECDSVIVRAGQRTIGSEAMSPVTLWIEPQAEIGRYRADFLLTARDRWGFDEYTDARLIVECDGHDFHERTKEQATHDRSRDRALQAMGLRVLRFTGSEIWADALKCAREAVSQATSAAQEEGRKLWSKT